MGKPMKIQYIAKRNFLKEFRMTRVEVKEVCTLVKEDFTTAGHKKCDVNLEQKMRLSINTLAFESF